MSCQNKGTAQRSFGVLSCETWYGCNVQGGVESSKQEIYLAVFDTEHTDINPMISVYMYVK